MRRNQKTGGKTQLVAPRAGVSMVWKQVGNRSSRISKSDIQLMVLALYHRRRHLAPGLKAETDTLTITLWKLWGH